jgi:hypothetical protein
MLARKQSASSWSAGDRRRCASRAGASAAEAPYRCSMARDFQPAIRIRSVSVPPCTSHWSAKVCRNWCGCSPGTPAWEPAAQHHHQPISQARTQRSTCGEDRRMTGSASTTGQLTPPVVVDAAWTVGG